MTKHEIYEALKADGAKLKAERFMSVVQLTETYTERFGHAPGEEPHEEYEEAPNSHLLREDGDDFPPVQEKAPEPEPEPEEASDKICLLRFEDDGWCPAIGKSYRRGLYRPATIEEYKALKPYAREVLA